MLLADRTTIPADQQRTTERQHPPDKHFPKGIWSKQYAGPPFCWRFLDTTQ